MERSDIVVPGARFAALEAGERRAPLVLCLHGFPDHPRTFERLSTHLVAAGYRVVAPWMRGYCPSPLQGPYDPETIARDVVAFATSLSPDDPVYLLGHDWGASAAYGAAALAPERFRALAALSVPHPLTFVRALLRNPAQRKKSWYMALFQVPFVSRVVRKDDFALIDRLYGDWSPGFHDDEDHVVRVKRCLAESMPAPIEYYRAAFRLTPARMFKARNDVRALTAIRVPTLYLHGKDDGCIGPEVGKGQERFFKNRFESVILDGAGHFMQLERPEAVAEHVIPWFASAV
jgi:pimeloyl-ACP methyl ester carboxylesterase